MATTKGHRKYLNIVIMVCLLGIVLGLAPKIRERLAAQPESPGPAAAAEHPSRSLEGALPERTASGTGTVAGDRGGASGTGTVAGDRGGASGTGTVAGDRGGASVGGDEIALPDAGRMVQQAQLIREELVARERTIAAREALMRRQVLAEFWKRQAAAAAATLAFSLLIVLFLARRAADWTGFSKRLRNEESRLRNLQLSVIGALEEFESELAAARAWAEAEARARRPKLADRASSASAQVDSAAFFDRRSQAADQEDPFRAPATGSLDRPQHTASFFRESGDVERARTFEREDRRAPAQGQAGTQAAHPSWARSQDSSQAPVHDPSWARSQDSSQAPVQNRSWVPSHDPSWSSSRGQAPSHLHPQGELEPRVQRAAGETRSDTQARGPHGEAPRSGAEFWADERPVARAHRPAIPPAGAWDDPIPQTPRASIPAEARDTWARRFAAPDTERPLSAPGEREEREDRGERGPWSDPARRAGAVTPPTHLPQGERSKFSTREHVQRLAAEGCSETEIARRLGLSREEIHLALMLGRSFQDHEQSSIAPAPTAGARTAPSADWQPAQRSAHDIQERR